MRHGRADGGRLDGRRRVQNVQGEKLGAGGCDGRRVVNKEVCRKAGLTQLTPGNGYVQVGQPPCIREGDRTRKGTPNAYGHIFFVLFFFWQKCEETRACGTNSGSC